VKGNGSKSIKQESGKTNEENVVNEKKECGKINIVRKKIKDRRKDWGM
jgi:hypothetical protein